MGIRVFGRSPDLHVVPKIFFVEVCQIPASPIIYHLSSRVKLLTAMYFDRPRRSTSRASSPLLLALTSLGEVTSPDPKSNGEVGQDQLAFTIESPSHPQLQLFETVFNTGKPLSAYCEDNPLWSLLAAVASPCTNCLKTPGKCQVPANSPQCTNCSSKKTCSLGKTLQYQYFARQCNQDLAYSRRFLELHGTPAHRATWGIPLDVWHQYDAALHERTSSTSTLLELNMLDEQDGVTADQQELQKFLALQQDEASVAAKQKCARSPLPVVGPSTKKVRLEVPKKCSRCKAPGVEVDSEPPCHVLLVVPPSRSLVTSTIAPVPPCALSSPMEVSVRDNPVQGSSGLVQLVTIAEAHSGLACRHASPPVTQVPIKGGESDIFSSNMPPTPCSTLVPRVLTAHPYRTENQRLIAQVRLLESQLADSRRENSVRPGSK
ncbi:uncharacterized protein C8R40DRAFT_1167796 [Lentinula edodes]|uniref:uncharacterized protein n=1 Tax=Lentinula edodes TaxID=5353 RepID=UPI001E8DECBF|nr:uncharacterized protein C8R40DRAFT_1167796 [Lentinula edodes]KAH7878370.1 hypothetical protein C8R40DRAFT_1167796 [Lentinula edodes]